MTLRSKVDLMTAVLQDLNIVAAGEEPSAEDSETVEGVIQDVYENLVDENLMVFDHSAERTTDVIPSRVFNALKDIVSDKCALRFGLPVEYGPDGMTDRERAGMLKLRRSVLSSDNSISIPAEFF